MSRPSHPLTTTSRWIGVLAVSLTVAAVPAIAPALSPRDIRVGQATRVMLAAEPASLVNLATPYSRELPGSSTSEVVRKYHAPASPAKVAGTAATAASAAEVIAARSDIYVVIDDFNHGGLAQVLLHQLTSRTTDPDQLQILGDFFEGGVFQSEAHRFLQLFKDPQQQEFINDFVTGGVIQMVRNRLLDATSDPGQRAAIIGFFPDEVTDYRGGPIDVVQRRLIAAAKGNPAVIRLVNAVIDNPILLAVRHLIGGGPIIGTPLYELPPLADTVSSAASAEGTVAEAPKTIAAGKTAPPASSIRRAASKPAAEPAASKPKITTEAEPEVATDSVNAVDADVSTTGNKVEPTVTGGASRPKPRGGLRIFGQFAESLAKSFAGVKTAASAATAGSGDAEGAGEGRDEQRPQTRRQR